MSKWQVAITDWLFGSEISRRVEIQVRERERGVVENVENVMLIAKAETTNGVLAVYRDGVKLATCNINDTWMTRLEPNRTVTFSPGKIAATVGNEDMGPVGDISLVGESPYGYFWFRRHGDDSAFIAYRDEVDGEWYLPGIDAPIESITRNATLLGRVPRIVVGGG